MTTKGRGRIILGILERLDGMNYASWLRRAFSRVHMRLGSTAEVGAVADKRIERQSTSILVRLPSGDGITPSIGVE